MELNKLLELDFNYWLSELKIDDERWLQVKELKSDLFDNYEGEVTPKNIRRYLCKRYMRVNGKAIREESVQLKAELQRLDDLLFFRVLLEKRMKQYKNMPYTGPLGIGHFVGIKKQVDDNPLKDYDNNHTIGYIRDYDEKNGIISQFILDMEDGSTITIPVEYMYRIY